jgi:hypothetical protein
MFVSKSKLHCDWRSVNQLSLGVRPHLGIMTRYLLLSDSYGIVVVGRPLWREDGSVFCICCWTSPAQSFSGLSPLDLATIFYSLFWDFRFRRLLRLAGSRWRYSTPPPYGSRVGWEFFDLFNVCLGTDRTENLSSITACCLLAGGTTCLLSCSLATAIFLSPAYTAVIWQCVYMSQYILKGSDDDV